MGGRTRGTSCKIILSRKDKNKGLLFVMCTFIGTPSIAMLK